MKKVVLITGASSGIGFAAAGMLAAKGCKVYAAARRVENIRPLEESGVVALKMDITEEDSVRAAVDAVLSAEGRIDVLVNNAGYGYFGAIETVSDEEARAQMEVNVFGLSRLTRMVLPSMRERRCGRIINTSSVAGRMVMYYGGWYHVSKYAVEAFSDALRMEMKPFGIDVSLIEPGGIRTDWGLIAARHLRESSAGTEYEKSASEDAAALEFGYSGKMLTDPGKVARAICRAALSRRPRTRYVTGFASHAILFFHAVLPARWWDALMRLGPAVGRMVSK